MKTNFVEANSDSVMSSLAAKPLPHRLPAGRALCRFGGKEQLFFRSDFDIRSNPIKCRARLQPNLKASRPT
jgi:hypothetical protein